MTDVDTSTDGLAALIEALTRDIDPSYGYASTDIRLEGGALRMTISKVGGSSFLFWLRPGTQGPRYQCGAHLHTAYEGQPDPLGFRFMDAIWQRVVSREAEVHDRLSSLPHGPAVIDRRVEAAGEHPRERNGGAGDGLQWLAVRTGLKPVCRQLLGGARLAQAIARAEQRGLAWECLPAAKYVARWADADASTGDTLLFVSVRPEAARRAAEAERLQYSYYRATAGPSLRERIKGLRLRLYDRAQQRALGEALGYPTCCSEFFAKRAWMPIGRVLFDAMARTQGTPSFLLNDLDLVNAIIPHYVCRYDCPPSMEYARALLAELSRIDVSGAAERRRALCGTAILFRDAGHLWLPRAAESASDALDAVRYARIESSGRWRDSDAWLHAARSSNELRHDGRHVWFLSDGRSVAVFAAPERSVRVCSFS